MCFSYDMRLGDSENFYLLSFSLSSEAKVRRECPPPPLLLPMSNLKRVSLLKLAISFKNDPVLFAYGVIMLLTSYFIKFLTASPLFRILLPSLQTTARRDASHSLLWSYLVYSCFFSSIIEIVFLSILSYVFLFYIELCPIRHINIL